jgi:peroxiredoxin
VVGCSYDTPEKNAQFKASSEFQYPLWSDTESTLSSYYDTALFEGVLMNRETVVLAPDGTWVLHYQVGLGIAEAAGHPHEVLEDLTLLLGP